MKIRADQLSRQLQDGLAPVYVISGDEALQAKECLDAIRQSAQDQGYAERIVLEVDNQFDWSTLRQYQDSLSLFAERRLIELRMPSTKPGRDGGPVLKDYAARPAEDTVLVLSGGKLDGNDTRSAWYKALDKAGVTIQVWPIDAQRLPGWVQERARGLGLELDREAAALLAERGEGNLLATVQELEKLLLAHGKGRLDLETVVNATADSARYSVFDLSTSALAGDVERSVRILRGLAEEGVAAPMVSWVLAREVRTLATVTAACQEGMPLDQAMRSAGVWRNREGSVRQAVRRLPAGRALALLAEAATVDRIVKGAPGHPWDALERLTLGLCGVTLFVQAPNMGPSLG